MWTRSGVVLWGVFFQWSVDTFFGGGGKEILGKIGNGRVDGMWGVWGGSGEEEEEEEEEEKEEGFPVGKE